MNPILLRPLLFSLLALLIALLTNPNQLIPDTQHPLCAQHPALSALCTSVHTALKRPTYPLEILPLTRALLKIPSFSGTEQRALQYAAAWLRKQNWQVKQQRVPPLEGSTAARQNVLALQPGSSSSNIRLVLCTHLDTVPGIGRPHDSKQVEHGLLRGRGSADAKGQAAGMMLAATAMKDPRVALLLLSGEEFDHGGIRVAHKLGFPSEVVLLNGEPTESKLVVLQKGMAKVRVSVMGHAAHSGYPELGVSAIHVMVDMLAALRKVQWPTGEGGLETTMNIGLVNGGVAANVIAPDAAADLLFRLAGEPEPVLRLVRDMAARYDNVSVEVLSANPPMKFWVPQQAAKELGTMNVAYNTDVPYYQGDIAGAVLFGAGSIETAHSDNESIKIDELELLPERLQKIAVETLNMMEKCKQGESTGMGGQCGA